MDCFFGGIQILSVTPTRKDHADALSQCPLLYLVEDPTPASSILQIEEIMKGPILAAEIARQTAKERTLARILNWAWRGWPDGTLEDELKLFKIQKMETSAMKGCLLWEGIEVLYHKP